MSSRMPCWFTLAPCRNTGVPHESILCDLAALRLALGFQDSYTQGHAVAWPLMPSAWRSASAAVAENAETIRIGGLLHDIGKIAFSPSF